MTAPVPGPATRARATPPRGTGARAIRLLLGAVVVAAAGAALVAAPGPAGAHAVVVASSPAAGQVLARAPVEVWVQFSEPVEAGPDGLRVLDAEGRRVDGGATTSPGGETLRTALPEDLPDGTYVVDHRVVSADGHPISGALVFGVGEGTALDPGAVGAATTDDRPVQVAAGAARFATFAGALGAAGLAVFVAFFHDGGRDRRRLVALARAAGAVGALGAVAAIPLQAALVSGAGWGVVTDGDALGRALDQGMGWGTALVLAGLVAVEAAAHLRRGLASQALAFYGALAVAASFAFWGHASTSEPRWLALGSDVVHAAAAALWFGGLVGLAMVLASRRSVTEAPVGTAAAGRAQAVVTSTAEVVWRFSDAAAVTVLVLVAAGVALATTQVSSVGELWSTTYGLLLLAKVALVAVVLALAAYNRWRLVPGIEALGEGEEAAEDDDEVSARAWRRLVRTVGAEAVLLVGALAVTAALVAVTPARTAAAPTGVAAFQAPLAEVGQVGVALSPAEVGPNVVHLQYVDEVGAPLGDVTSVVVELAQPGGGVGPITVDAREAGPGHFIADGLVAPMAGAWELTVTTRLGRFDQERNRFPIELG